MEYIKKGILLIIILCMFPMVTYSNNRISNEYYEKVRSVITRVEEDKEDEVQIQIVEAIILEGQFKSDRLIFKHLLIEGSKSNISLKEDMQVFLNIRVNGDVIESVNFLDVVRDGYLKILFGMFFMLLIIFGGFKGFRSFIALVVTALCLIYLFIPMIMRGYNLIMSAVIVSSIIVVSSFIIISGFTKKSLVAILGTIGGTMTSGVLAIFFGNKIYLTGVSDEIVELLVAYSTVPIDYRGLLYSGIIIGALGAVMDVSMTITSVICEIRRNNPNTRIRSLFFSGLSVGKDIMATMTNTLILAYVGTSLPLLLIFIFSDMAVVDIVNSQYIASEIIRSLCGSVGLVLTIPITSVLAALNILKFK
ncbi:YibE/F family protein [Serpentinicella alkaliphila]|uniref:Putative membrane protein n=1 Tax=Serpentinicella alkaliphila TaxID=1734049 RepID=A0A4R2TDM5_9FIRM|nr:YibE/F family protein [Serpentinicella alkaliphila]QUH25392.1 YibE/F family protein [Serpentinicella alkaliphila]TCQ01570.1 putative membrane protein [Serpentinicella alkaliphila]